MNKPLMAYELDASSLDATIRIRPASFYVNKEMHSGVYGVVLCCWSGFVAALWATFYLSSQALCMVAIGTAFGAVYFGVPMVLARVPSRRKVSPLSFGQFLYGKLDTLNGPVRGWEALLQVVLVPMVLAAAAPIFGVIVHLARAGY